LALAIAAFGQTRELTLESTDEFIHSWPGPGVLSEIGITGRTGRVNTFERKSTGGQMEISPGKY